MTPYTHQNENTIDILIIQMYKRPHFSTRGCKPELLSNIVGD